MVCLAASQAWGQTFTLEHKSDSLSLLVLENADARDVWRLPYPTYAFATADVDGDGSIDAMVGVVKPTRFDPRMARRLFVFRNVRGRIRPLWLGSRLCGHLQDFRTDSRDRLLTLERDRHGTWFVGSYVWQSFGFTLDTTLVNHASHNTAEAIFRGLQ